MKKGMFLLFVFFSTHAWAGKFEIVGEGTASHAAEFIRVNISDLAFLRAQENASGQLIYDRVDSESFSFF
jgi:hypothetical protein